MQTYEIYILYAGIRWNLIKNQREPLSELMQSVRQTNIERMSNLLVTYS